tara:strand:- start:934 stop:1119 length:186 start_codon:yes stop_codon:yes gene_type:complete
MTQEEMNQLQVGDIVESATTGAHYMIERLESNHEGCKTFIAFKSATVSVPELWNKVRSIHG